MSILQPDSIVPSSTKLSHNSVDSSNNNNYGFSYSSSSASQDHINFPSKHQLDIRSTPTKPSQPPGRTHPMILRQNPKKKILAFMSVLDDKDQPSSVILSEPACYTKALKVPSWREAMSSEMSALIQHQTWKLVPKPSHSNIVGCK